MIFSIAGQGYRHSISNIEHNWDRRVTCNIRSIRTNHAGITDPCAGTPQALQFSDISYILQGFLPRLLYRNITFLTFLKKVKNVRYILPTVAVVVKMGLCARDEGARAALCARWRGQSSSVREMKGPGQLCAREEGTRAALCARGRGQGSIGARWRFFTTTFLTQHYISYISQKSKKCKKRKKRNAQSCSCG